jgi:hypothetical protein
MPIRVIAKKRDRAMFETPGDKVSGPLNPNPSTRLNLPFSEDAKSRVTPQGG